ncbi:serine/threonine kinase [Fragilaria crotonensis]|nr:serine/threonine kinase [Fragilaria crotonensis]
MTSKFPRRKKPLSENVRKFFNSTYNGNLQEVREMLRSRGDVNAQHDDDDAKSLFIASCHGHVQVVRELLRNNKVDVNLPFTCGATALYISSQNGHVEVVRMLLQQRKVDVNHQLTCGFTALHIACEKGHVDVVRLLLRHPKVDANLQFISGASALYVASQNGHVDVVQELLQSNAVEVNAQCNDGKTALYVASENGYVEIVRELLHNNKADATLEHTGGFTALFIASEKGHVEVVRELLQSNNVDVNLQLTSGFTALDVALKEKKDGVACLLKEFMERDKRRVEKDQNHRLEEQRNRQKDVESKQALEEKRLRQVLFSLKSTGSDVEHRATGDTPRRKENSPSSDDAMHEQDRRKLLYVMNKASADPVELSFEYIKRCLTAHKLGSGAFGDVFLAEESRLPKTFAVKMISPTHCDQATIEEIRKSFRTELSILKRFRHPNIIVLYGYSLNANNTQQCLVYEYAANGSLAGFLTDDGNRARLSADIRLSIMFELARAVHFLHTGGCKVAGMGWKVFHRDIKSANICLAEDFTPRLIDCGLAKFVRDDNANANPGVVTPSVNSTRRDGTFGTPGYMCPEYVRKKFEGTSCPYIAAYDVYSIGVVLVELILGCLTGGQSTRNGMHFENAFRRYVKDDRDRLIVDGWEQLKRDADPAVIWNAASLELVCKAAIKCMAPFSDERMSTKDLLDKLREAIGLNSDTCTRHAEAVHAAVSGPICDICNDNRTDIKCSEGHALCKSCIEQNLLHHLSDRSQLLCLINGCSSQPIKDKDLVKCITVDMYNLIIEKRTERKVLDKYLKRIEAKIDKVISDGQKQQQMLQELAKGVHRSLAALAILSADQFKECPNLVWMTPISVEKNDLRNPKNWFTQKYSVVFICAHSGEPGHEPFEIEMPRKWIAKIAPWLKLCLLVFKTIVSSQGLPFPIPDLPFLEQHKMMKAFLDSMIAGASNALVAHCEALLEHGTMSIDACGQVQALAGDAFKFIAEKAKNGKTELWMPPQMVPVCHHNGTAMWVKGKYRAHQ